ncbi:MAG: trigger factor [Chloroflexota bacterium]
MKVTKEDLENCEVIMTVEIEDKQKTRLLEKAAKRIAREVRIPGFRPGKAPYRTIVNKFGLEAVQNEAMEDLTSDIFQKALEEAEVTPYAQASLDEVEWEPLVMKVKIPVEPVVELEGYRDIRVDFETPEATDEELNEELERLQDQQATFEVVERAAAQDDLVAVTISEKDIESGEMVQEEHDLDITILEPDEERTTPDVGPQLVGLTVDEHKVFNHTYPEDYAQSDLAGKEVEVYVKVNTVSEKELPELDDDFAGLIGDYETLDALKEKLSDDIISRKQYDIDRELMDGVLDQALDTIKDIKWPAILEDQELDGAVERQKGDASRQGMDWQTYLQTQQMTEDELRESLREDAHDSIRRSLLLSKIIELEELQLDSDALRQQAEFMSMIYGQNPEMANSFRSPAGLQLLANNMLMDQARSFLLRVAKGEVEAEEIAAAEEAAKKAAEEAELATEADTIEGEVVAEVEEEASSEDSAAEEPEVTTEAVQSSEDDETDTKADGE